MTLDRRNSKNTTSASQRLKAKPKTRTPNSATVSVDVSACIVKQQVDSHSDKLAELERKLADTKITYDYSQNNVVNAPAQPAADGRDAGKEIQNELKHLSDRLKSTQDTLAGLLRKRGDGISTAPTVETHEDDDDEVREGLEHQLQGIKTRLSRVEDSNGTLAYEFFVPVRKFRTTH